MLVSCQSNTTRLYTFVTDCNVFLITQLVYLIKQSFRKTNKKKNPKHFHALLKRTLSQRQRNPRIFAKAPPTRRRSPNQHATRRGKAMFTSCFTRSGTECMLRVSRGLPLRYSHLRPNEPLQERAPGHGWKVRAHIGQRYCVVVDRY